VTIFSFLSKLLSPKPAKQVAEIVIENDGFRLKENGTLGELWLWANQEEVAIGRTVLNAREYIWIDFLIPDGDDYFSVDEEMPGFEALLAALEHKLPGFGDNSLDLKVGASTVLQPTLCYPTVIIPFLLR